MSYDIKCLTLAASFLDDHPQLKSTENLEKLAQEIQTTIEDWIEDAETTSTETKAREQ